MQLPAFETRVQRGPTSSVGSFASVAPQLKRVSVASVLKLQPWHPIAYALRRVTITFVVAQGKIVLGDSKQGR